MDWDWSQFLKRPDPIVDAQAAKAAVQGRCVLITGAGGSIGSCLASATLLGDPRSVILLDNSEYALYQVYRKLDKAAPGKASVIPMLGDILTPGYLTWIMRQHSPDLIFHAAAYKHVPLLECNPFAAMRNNALGTFHIAQSVADRNGCSLVLVSTDKAVEPQSIMGASKRIAELAILAQENAACAMSIVRLSNVLGSSGSVVPLFAEQLRQGVAVTVTHPGVSRYLITSNEAAQALQIAAAKRLRSRVLVPQATPSSAIPDLARYMIDRYRAGVSNSVETQIEIIGLRPGEKLQEKLVANDEIHEQTCPSGHRVFKAASPNVSEFCAHMALLEDAVSRFDEPAFYAAIASLVPETTSWQLPQERGKPEPSCIS